jgi:hypothetical protein
MLDLARFATIKEVVMPIIDGWGQFEGRKVYGSATENGWYLVALGADTKILRKATLLETHKALRGKKADRVYPFGNEVIPMNFDNFHRRGVGETAQVNFMDRPLFSVAKVVEWEDGRFYFYEEDRGSHSRTIRTIKEIFEKDGVLQGVRNTTPELRYYFLLASLQREGTRALEELAAFAVAESERAKRIAAYKANFGSRLQDAVERAGGKYLRHYRSGKAFMVEWEVGGQVVKSTVHDDLRVVSAGFCLSGDDKLHTVNSIVNLAKSFQDRAPLYITRE